VGGLFVAVTALAKSQGESPKASPTVVKRHSPVVTERRIAGANSSGTDDSALNPFTSAADCEHLVTLGHRAKREPNQARLGAWNVRWFPDGIPGNTASATQATDVAWLGCAIAWLNVDAMALVEVKSKPRSLAALDALAARLTQLTNEPHAYRIDDCPDSSGLHVGWLWNEKRVNLSLFRMYSAVNPYGDSCAKQLRPGFAVQMRFPGGLDLTALAVHLKSGTTPRDLELRRRSLVGLNDVVKNIVHETGDSDVFVLGDMNSMGCDSCEDVKLGSAEAQVIDTLLAGYHVPMRRVPSDLGCSHYYQRNPGLLDHFFVTRASREVSRVTKVETQGYCQQLSCESYTGKAPLAATQLSDHCPVALSVRDEDLD
jgi:predicted extracellular nuclease